MLLRNQILACNCLNDVVECHIPESSTVIFVDRHVLVACYQQLVPILTFHSHTALFFWLVDPSHICIFIHLTFAEWVPI